jgi:urea carboxylase-associated protein 1
MCHVSAHVWKLEERLPMTDSKTIAPPAGKKVEEVVIPPRGKLAREVRQGQTLRIIDLQGQQVGDIIAFNLHNLAEKFWISNTIRLNKTVYVTAGHVLYSELSNPMFTIVADTCGRHDLLAGSCNAEIDKVRYGLENHRGCVENFLGAIEPYGLKRQDIPMSLNLFMNCPVKEDGSWTIAAPVSKAGDYVDLRAEMDCLFVLSNCPQDLNPCNAGDLKPLKVEFHEALLAQGA